MTAFPKGELVESGLDGPSFGGVIGLEAGEAGSSPRRWV